MGDIEARVHNLEVALHVMWVLLKDLQPPATQQDIDNMMADHFDSSSLKRRRPAFILTQGASDEG